MKKKLFFLLVACFTFVVGLEAAITVRLKAASCPDWTSVSLYAWTVQAPDLLGGWPGVALAQDDEGYWSYTFADGVAGVNFIFNCPDLQQQTIDIPNVSASADYLLGAPMGSGGAFSVSVEGSDVPVSPYDFQSALTSLFFQVTGDKQAVLVNELGRSPYYYSSFPSGDLFLPQSVSDASGNFTDFEVTAVGAYAFAGCGTAVLGGAGEFVETFQTSLGDFTVYNETGEHTWVHERDYAKITGYSAGTQHDNKDWLISPVFDLAGKSSIRLSYDQAINHHNHQLYMPGFHEVWFAPNYTGDPTACDWYFVPLDGVNMPSGNDWNFVTTELVLPADVAAANSVFAFVYSAEAQFQQASTWNIQNVRLTWETPAKEPLTSVVLPASISSLGDSAFYMCDGLQSITFSSGLAAVPALGEDVFLGCTALSAIYVPCGMGDDFRTQWSQYAGLIVESDDTYSIGSSNLDYGGVGLTQQPTCANGNVAVVEAVPAEGYRFWHWSNGMQELTDNPLTVDMDTIFSRYLTAAFVPEGQTPITVRLKKDETWDNCYLYHGWYDGAHVPKELTLDDEGFYTYELMEWPANISFATKRGAGDEVSMEFTIAANGVAVSTDFYLNGRNAAGEWLLSSVAAGTDACAEPVRDLAAQYVDNKAVLTWTVPVGASDWLTWSDGRYTNGAVGIGAAAEFDVAQRFSQEDLQDHVGKQLTQVAFVPVQAEDTCSYTVRVWLVEYVPVPDTEGLMSEQRTLMAEVPMSGWVPGRWCTATLPVPVAIDGTQELWIGYHVKCGNGYPAATDNNLPVIGRNMIMMSGDESFTSLDRLGVSGNWLIKGLLEQPVAGQKVAQAIPVRRPAAKEAAARQALSGARFTVDPASMAIANAPDARPAARRAMARVAAADDVPAEPFYRVYMDGELLSTTSVPRYEHPVCSQGIYAFEVEYVDGECVSPRVAVNLTADPQAIAPVCKVVDYTDAQGYKVVVSAANPLACAVRYKVYNHGEYVTEWDATRYTGTYLGIYPGDFYSLQLSAVVRVDNLALEMESPLSEPVEFMLECLRSAPAITDIRVDGEDVYLYWTVEAEKSIVSRKRMGVDNDSIAWTREGWSANVRDNTDKIEGAEYCYTIGAICTTLNDTLWGEPRCVTIEPCTVTGEDTKTAYGSYTWGDNTYDESGDYTATFKTANGCDSIVTLHLIVHPIPVITFKAHKDVWTEPNLSCQWQDETGEMVRAELVASEGNYNWWQVSPTAYAMERYHAGEEFDIAFRQWSVYPLLCTQYVPYVEENTCYTAGNLDGRTVEENYSYDGVDNYYEFVEGNLYAIECNDDDHSVYYASLNGKAGDELRAAAQARIDDPQVVSYYSGLATAYEITDRRSDGSIWDMYSDCTGTFSSPEGTSEECSASYNREHSLPKSWWKHRNESITKMYTDIMHVIPTNSTVNSARGAYPYSEVAVPQQEFGNGSKVGMSTYPGYSDMAFDPADEYKGDLARIYFYMATCYWDENFAQNTYPSGSINVFEYVNGHSEFTDFATKLFLKWHRQDPVSDKERDRNDAVQSIQGNRNPFVDLPDLAEYLWGYKKGQVFGSSGPGTGMAQAGAAGVDIAVEAGVIRVALAAPDHVEVYDVLGRHITTTAAAAETHWLRVPVAGVYVLHIGGTAYKVLVP